MKEKDSPVLGLHIEGPYLNPKMAGTQYDGFLKLRMKMNIFLYWRVRLASDVGILVPNYPVHMILQSIPVRKEL